MIIALGTPAELVKRHGGNRVLRLSAAGEPDPALLSDFPGVAQVTMEGSRVRVTGTGDFAPAIIAALSSAGHQVRDLDLTDPSLDDVFLTLTGRQLRDGGQ